MDKTEIRFNAGGDELYLSIYRRGVDILDGSFPTTGHPDLHFITHTLGQVMYLYDE